MSLTETRKSKSKKGQKWRTSTLKLQNRANAIEKKIAKLKKEYALIDERLYRRHRAGTE